jgi:TolB-like protein/Flp pilus assembly protein TadD
MRPTQGVRFGVFRLDLLSGELYKQEHKIKLQQKPFQILAALLDRPGEVVTREELRRQIWPPDTFVDFDHSLKTAISKIRDALGDSAEKPRYLETLPRRGYRFIAAVEEVPTSASLEDQIRLAVLPFENLSNDREQEYFSDGITDETIVQLGSSQPRQLAVIARTSAMHYKRTDKRLDQIGQELNVNHIVEGSVRRAGDRVRITAQLVRVSDQTHLWAHSYERDLRNVLALQSEVARAISNEIQVKLTPQHWARNMSALPANRQAYEAYLRGRYYLDKRTQEGTQKVIDYFQEAIAHDSRYALAYAGLADGYRIQAVCGWLAPSVAREKALPAALKALEIDDRLSEAHRALGAARFRLDWEWKQSEADLLRALELNPNDAEARRVYALYLQAVGRIEDAIAELERARELDPLSLLMETAMGRTLYFARRYEAAVAQCRRALELDPDYRLAQFNLGRALVETGKGGEAIAEFKKATRRGEALYLGGLGYAYARSEQQDRARGVLKQLETLAERNYVSAYESAKVHAGLGQAERAMEWLERAYTERAVGIVVVKVDPVFDLLHSDPRFQGLLRRMGLPA